MKNASKLMATPIWVSIGQTKDAATRYKIMLGVIAEPAPRPLKLLDFGCGAGHLLEFIEAEKLNHIDYIGLDISPKFIALCRSKWPERDFIETDILIDQNQLPSRLSRHERRFH